jgi:hypothetical protein
MTLLYAAIFAAANLSLGAAVPDGTSSDHDQCSAVVPGNPIRIAAIDRVEKVDRAFADVLRLLGDRFAYTALLDAIQLLEPEAARPTPGTNCTHGKYQFAFLA